MKQEEQDCKHTVKRMEYGIENRMAIYHLLLPNETKHFIRSLQTILVATLTMTLMSGCAASLTDFGYEGGTNYHCYS